MKKITVKIIAVLAAVILLTTAMAPAVFAEDFLGNLGNFGELLGGGFDLGGIADIIGGLFNGGGNGNGISLSDIFANPNGVLDIIRERLANMDIDASNATIAQAITTLLSGYGNGDITSMLSSNDFLNQLAEYLQANQTTTRPAEETTTLPQEDEPTTENETTTELATYEMPTIIIPSTYVYQGADPYSTQPAPTTTEPVYSYSFTYEEQPTQYVEPATTVPFVANYEENTKAVSSNSTKLAIGAAIVLLSAGAIVAVAVMLKKTKA